MPIVNIKGLDKAKVLVALYSAARKSKKGFALLHAPPISEAEARHVLKTETYFQYIHGRAMKVDLSSDLLDTRLYNRDNGHEAAENAIAHLFEGEQNIETKLFT
jgi:hypothetical protein